MIGWARSRAVPIALFVALASAYALVNSGFDVTEGLDDVKLARHLVAGGGLAFTASPGGPYAQGPDGRFYASHELGSVVMMLPVVAAGKVIERADASAGANRVVGLLVVFLPCIYTALTAVGFWRLLRALRIDERSAVVATMMCGLCTIQICYSRMLFDGVLAATAVTWTYAILVDSERSSSWRGPLGAGLAYGFAMFTRQSVLALLPCIGVFLLTAPAEHGRSAVWRRVAVFAIGMMPFAIGVAWYNAMRTGSALTPAVALLQYQSNNSLDGNVVVGLAGMLVSPGKSMFLFSPILMLAVPGLYWLWRQERRAGLFLASSAFVFLLVHARLRNWAGDWGWGPRYAVTVTPLLFAPAAFVVSRMLAGGRARATWLWALTALSLAVQVAGLVINWHYRYAYLSQQGLFSRSRSAWSLAHGQWADAMVGAFQNLQRVAGLAVDAQVVDGASRLNVLASNTLNVWWLTAVRAGAPVWVVTAIGLLLVCACLSSVGVLVRAVRVSKLSESTYAPVR